RRPPGPGGQPAGAGRGGVAAAVPRRGADHRRAPVLAAAPAGRYRGATPPAADRPGRGRHAGDPAVRRALARVAFATTSMVALAFLVPLGLAVRAMARERALAESRQQASAMVVALTVTEDPVALSEAVASTSAGATGRLAIHPPDGVLIGTARVNPADVGLVAQGRRSAVRGV